jgi:quinol monooxygenase YgiN
MIAQYKQYLWLQKWDGPILCLLYSKHRLKLPRDQRKIVIYKQWTVCSLIEQYISRATHNDDQTSAHKHHMYDSEKPLEA